MAGMLARGLQLAARQKGQKCMKLNKTAPIVAASLALIFLSGCGSHDAQWENGYNYAINNSSNATQYLVPGITTQSDWCTISQKWAASSGPIGGDFMAGCVAGLQNAGVYP
jgi:hypothetical protein